MSRGNRTRRMARAETRAARDGAIESGRASAIGAAGEMVAARTGEGEAFSFGDPEPVLDGRLLLDMAECWTNGRWYVPPLPLDGLARAFRVSPHHSSAIMLKRNLLVGAFQPTPLLARAEFERLVQDLLVFGNGYLQRIDNRLGQPMRLRSSPAKFTRRGVVEGTWFWAPYNVPEEEFVPNSIAQVMQPDVNQEIYGVPEYLSALQSALLNEAATLFRRRYYLNGSHAGYILYATGDIDSNDTGAIKDALRKSKGPGNFRNLFVHAPNGKDGSLKILPIAEVGAKDEFLGIKNATRDDILAAHRVPPQLIGIVPAQGSALGNPLQATDMFFELEIAPLQARLLDLNDVLHIEAVRFKERARPVA